MMTEPLSSGGIDTDANAISQELAERVPELGQRAFFDEHTRYKVEGIERRTERAKQVPRAITTSSTRSAAGG